jgi:hypothetical protein
MLSSIPLPARVLGLAGLLPFWGCAILAAFGQGEWAAAGWRAQLAYGAVILSFLGAVHWGVALRVEPSPSWVRLGWSVTPALIGWAALLLPPVQGLGLLAVGLAVALGVDLQTLEEPAAPRWYGALRRMLTTGALASLLVTLLGR